MNEFEEMGFSFSAGEFAPMMGPRRKKPKPKPKSKLPQRDQRQIRQFHSVFNNQG